MTGILNRKLKLEISKEEFCNRYGDVVVKFSYYYKYVFTFNAELPDGSKLIIAFGGSADFIFNIEVNNNEEHYVKDMETYAVSGSVYDKDDKTVCCFWDYR